MYNIPQITKIKIKADLINNLQEKFGTNFIKGVKDSSGDINQTNEYLKSNNIMTTVGDERLIARTIKLGGAGSICGLSQLKDAGVSNNMSDVSSTSGRTLMMYYLAKIIFLFKFNNTSKFII